MTGTPRLHRVLIDCTAIPTQRAGVGRYVEGLLSGMRAGSVELVLVAQLRDRSALAESAPWATIVTLPPALRFRALRLIWEQLLLPVVAARNLADVVHSPHYTFPLGWRGRQVVTVHDATFFSDAASHTFIKRHFFRWWTARAWKRADAVITPSAASAGEVERYLGPPRGLVEVAHLGVDAKVFRPPGKRAIEAFAKAHGLTPDTRWFAFLGTIEPRKSVPALLDAYAAQRAVLHDSMPLLLISGARGWDAEANARLDSLPQNSGVVELGFLPRTELSALLGGSVAVVYPSLGEGFGLPVLEAMATGAAVVTTNRLAIPEVGGTAVMYVEPDAGSLAVALGRLATDSELALDLSARSIARARLFTWQSTAELHVRAYCSVAEEE